MTSDGEEAQNMAIGAWNLRTLNGYPADEVISAIQKSIRRGDCEGAVFWSHEANISGLGAWVWRRLMIITSEDVGLAVPEAPAIVNGLYQLSLVLLAHQKKQGAGEKVQYPWLQVLQCVWYLTRCPKNRELADMTTLFEIRAQRHQFLEVPDIALDMHTRRGRAMGRGARHFEDDSPQGARWVANEVEIDHNQWKTRFYKEWVPPTDPASRSYKVLDPPPEDPPAEPSSD